jgi:hypothetical protein
MGKIDDIPDTLVDLCFVATCDTLYIHVRNTVEFQLVLQYMADDLDHIINPSNPIVKRERIIIFFNPHREAFKKQIQCKLYNAEKRRCMKNWQLCNVFRELENQ